jgi:hypothetical protein
MLVSGALGVALIHAGCGSASKSGFDTSTDPNSAADLDGSDNSDSTSSSLLGGNSGTDSGGNTSHVVEGGLFNDASLNIDASSCVADAGGPGPVTRVCLSATNNECDGAHDFMGFPANGTNGNGFDDDCDGLVDEGCACGGAGTTKDCYLVPASQTQAGLPVGFCAQSSKGTVDCVKQGEFPGTWSGQCRGAQPPFSDDVCAPGDFDCDGKDENSKTHDCSCKQDPVQCPTAPVTTVPYPPSAALPLKVDAAAWFTNPAQVASATNWKWTLRGGDCDNILPHPTFQMYPTANGSGGGGVGTQSNVLGPSTLEHGIIATAPLTSFVYPAFSVSGDYLMQGEFDLGGQHYSCQEKIQVRAPGLRAEACWDTESAGVDLDLHLSKVDGTFAGCTKKGWSTTCTNEDCYYGNCVNASTGWYTASPASACQGWGSQTTSSTCGNPRLDRDANGLSGTCDSTVTNPNKLGFGGYCGPENINVDTPADASEYAVAVKYYGGSALSKTHVNVYCNGERILSTGYNPVTGNQYPQLKTSGQNATGDMWKVALVTAKVTGGTLSCVVDPVPSTTAHAATDGTSGNCVDNTSTDTAQCTEYLTSGGGTPAAAAALCFH